MPYIKSNMEHIEDIDKYIRTDLIKDYNEYKQFYRKMEWEAQRWDFDYRPLAGRDFYYSETENHNTTLEGSGYNYVMYFLDDNGYWNVSFFEHPRRSIQNNFKKLEFELLDNCWFKATKKNISKEQLEKIVIVGEALKYHPEIYMISKSEPEPVYEEGFRLSFWERISTRKHFLQYRTWQKGYEFEKTANFNIGGYYFYTLNTSEKEIRCLLSLSEDASHFIFRSNERLHPVIHTLLIQTARLEVVSNEQRYHLANEPFCVRNMMRYIQCYWQEGYYDETYVNNLISEYKKNPKDDKWKNIIDIINIREEEIPEFVKNVKIQELEKNSSDVETQYQIGFAYLLGLNGTTKNEFTAVIWFYLAASRGYAKAQNILGNCFYNGWGCLKDTATAIEWYMKSAKQGYEFAKMTLKWCVQNGLKVPTQSKLSSSHEYLNRGDDTILRVTYPNGISICKETAADTFCQIIDWVGPEKVAALHQRVAGFDMVSKIRSDKYSSQQHDISGGWKVMTLCNTIEKKRILDYISSYYNLRLSVEIV